MRLADVKIQTKVAGCMVALAIAVTTATALMAVRMHETASTYAAILDQEVQAAIEMNAARAEAFNFGRLANALILAEEKTEIEKIVRDIRDSTRQLHELTGKAGLHAPEFAAKIAATEKSFDRAIASYQVFETELLAGRRDTAIGARREMSKNNTTARADLAALVKDLNADLQNRSTTLDKAAAKALWQSIGITAFGFLATLAVAMLLVRRTIAQPMAKLQSSMRALAEGDLAVEIDGAERHDEIGTMAKAVLVFKQNGLKARELAAAAELMRTDAENARAAADAERAARAGEQATVVGELGQALSRLAARDLTTSLANFPADYKKLERDFNGAVAALRDAMGVIADNSSAISSGTSEISTAADDLSKRTEQQAAGLEETAAAVDQITATSKQAADGAQHAQKVVSATQSEAAATSTVVKNTVAAMSEIEASSQQIHHIISVIDEIAFQTNLLALNAGVEAARAGETGKGFAVVASEVRALAQRAAGAAKEIKQLITNSSEQIAQGVTLVNEAGSALQRILDQVNDINTVVGDIATGAKEQASSLAQINAAIAEMDKATQQNASMVEETTAASHSVASEAGQLADLVARFNLGRRAGEKKASPAPATPPARMAIRAPAGRSALARSPAVETSAEQAAWDDF